MKKSHRKEVWFTDEEWEHISSCADDCGMKVGTYIQIMAVRGKIIKFDLKELDFMEELIKLRTELNKIGVNINQVAHKVNITSKVYQADMNYLKGVFDRYKNTFDEIVFDTQKHLMELDKIKNEILKLKG